MNKKNWKIPLTFLTNSFDLCAPFPCRLSSPFAPFLHLYLLMYFVHGIERKGKDTYSQQSRTTSESESTNNRCHQQFAT